MYDQETLATIGAIGVMAFTFWLRRRQTRRVTVTAKGSAIEMRWLPSREPNDEQTAMVSIVRNILAANNATQNNVTVTSGTRTAQDQAKAMLSKLERFGPEHLLGLYRQNRDIIESLLEAPKDIGAWADLIARFATNGRPLSRHLAGRAVDLRVKDLSAKQRKDLVSAARKAVAHPRWKGRGSMVDEGDHLHLQW